MRSTLQADSTTRNRLSSPVWPESGDHEIWASRLTNKFQGQIFADHVGHFQVLGQLVQLVRPSHHQMAEQHFLRFCQIIFTSLREPKHVEVRVELVPHQVPVGLSQFGDRLRIRLRMVRCCSDMTIHAAGRLIQMQDDTAIPLNSHSYLHLSMWTLLNCVCPLQYDKWWLLDQWLGGCGIG